MRKYLLRLRQEHVKFWRPQILLFVTNLDEQYKMVSFCNSLKKGALFVLGHVLVTDDFSAAVPEARRQQSAWTKLVEYSRVKAFVNIAVAPSIEWGVRNVVLNSGLGGMRPNIVVIDQFRKGQSLGEVLQLPGHRKDSTNSKRYSHETHGESLENGTHGLSRSCSMSCRSYVTILEDLLFKLRINVAVAKGFEDLELPSPDGQHTKKYIDLWPIQMLAELGADTESKQNVLTTNFDTYTLILQLGCILNTVPSWKKTYRLRVAVFVEYETDVEDERRRVEALLEKLRIEAEVLVFWLACGDLEAYRIIVNGDMSPDTKEAQDRVHAVLEQEDWWQELRQFRSNSKDFQGTSGHLSVGSLPERMSSWSGPWGHEMTRSQSQMAGGLRKFIQSRRRRSISSFKGFGGVSLGMKTHRLLDSLVDYDSSASESSSDSEFEPYASDDDGGEEGTLETDGHNSQSHEAVTSPITDQMSPQEITVGQDLPSIITTGEEASPKSKVGLTQPPISRSPSTNRFSSSPIPEARVSSEETAGPSIMFAPSSSPPRFPNRLESIYTRRSSSGARSASGYPKQASVPLSFDDLPSRAQHLILNELMARQSSQTAVIFTTLPSPSEGTAGSEETSESYLRDLEVLWQGLPPCLLVHSNSMTVTMNL